MALAALAEGVSRRRASQNSSEVMPVERMEGKT